MLFTVFYLHDPSVQTEPVAALGALSMLVAVVIRPPVRQIESAPDR